jgi:hypothetical protein
MRLAEAKIELKKHPSYGNAATVKALEREFETLVGKRRESIKSVYDFHEDLLDKVELGLLGLVE